MTSYDVHAHIVPPPAMDRLRREGTVHGVELGRNEKGMEHLVVGGEAAGDIIPPLVDVEQRLAAMDASGVDVQLLSPYIEVTAYELPASTAGAYSRWFNETLAEVAAEHPDRFLTLANVPMAHPEQAAAELRHAVEELGMVGCEIGTTIAGDEMDQFELDPFWSTAEELGCLVLLHPMRSLAGRNVTRYFLNNLVGNPAESTITVAHLIMSGVFERHPDLQFCMVHGGGFLPYQIGRWDRGFREKPGGMANVKLTRSPSEWARTLYYDTVTHSPEALRFLIDLMGIDQVVLGSDHPFAMGDDDPVTTVRATPGLTEAEETAILSGNVERILSRLKR